MASQGGCDVECRAAASVHIGIGRGHHYDRGRALPAGAEAREVLSVLVIVVIGRGYAAAALGAVAAGLFGPSAAGPTAWAASAAVVVRVRGGRQPAL